MKHSEKVEEQENLNEESSNKTGTIVLEYPEGYIAISRDCSQLEEWKGRGSIKDSR